MSTKKLSYPEAYLQLLRNTARVSPEVFRAYVRHLSVGNSRASFPDCHHLTVELAALQQPKQYDPELLMMAYRSGHTLYERMLQDSIDAEEGPKLRTGLVITILKQRYGFGKSGHYDAPFSDMPEDLYQPETSAAPETMEQKVLKVQGHVAKPESDVFQAATESRDSSLVEAQPEQISKPGIPRHLRRQMMREEKKMQKSWRQQEARVA